MRRIFRYRYPAGVPGVFLLLALAIPVPATGDGFHSGGSAAAQDLTARFSLAGPAMSAPDCHLDLPSDGVPSPAGWVRPRRLVAGRTVARGQTSAATEPLRRAKLSGELSLGYVTFTTKGIGSGIRYGMAFLAMASPRIGIEVVLERLRAPVDGDEDPFGLGAGTFHVTPLTVNTHYRWPEMGRFTPYAMLGVGFHFAHFLPEEGDEEVADRLALIFGGGADARIGRNVALHAGLKFAPVPTWVQLKGSHPEPDDQKKIWINPLTLTLGIKYYFE